MKIQIDQITKELRSMSHQEPWASQMMYLMQIPGFGVVTGMTVLAAIGDITRFETPKALASYSGLTPGVDRVG
jgi:transposase